MGRYRGHEILGPRSRGADILGAQFQHIFEVGRDVGEFSLQEEDNVLGVLGLLGCGGGVLDAREGLERRDLGVQRGEVLFDYVG